ncbi:hypothetical protein MNBD_ALPHA11-1506 [hydrothermal vent metagenome]|uniref:Uncharacterized protein n=1 Tax=hydrothermal vent metagenome TaxID=652676 RepID=A0A3B0TGR1_9ZZZZ
MKSLGVRFLGNKSQKSLEVVYDKRLLTAAVSSMHYGFSVWDDEFVLKLFNQRFLDIYDLMPNEVGVGSSLYQLCEYTTASGLRAGWSVDRLHDSLKQRLLDQKQYDKPSKIEQKIGDKTIRTSIARHGEIGWIVSHEDISEDVEIRRKSQENQKRLLAQSEWFDRAINSMSQGLCVFDGDRRLIICNRTYADVYGLPKELTRPGTEFKEIMRHRIENGRIPEGKTAKSHLANRMELVNSQNVEQKFTEVENGRSIYVVKNPMPGGGWIGVIHDVSDERKNEELVRQRSEELKLQNLRFGAAVQHMAQGLVMFDAEHRLVICNEKWQQLYGLPNSLCKPGTSFEDIMAHCLSVGMIVEADDDRLLESFDEVVNDLGSEYKIFELSDGRFISVSHKSIDDGGFVSTHEDITDRRRSEERIKYMARHDSLTQLPNRTYFNEEMKKAESRIQRGDKMALLCLDLDNFKEINDTYGHGIGDEVLRRVSARLKQGKRQHEIVARMGGDEFMYMALPIKSKECATNIATRILEKLAKPLTIEGYEIIAGTSIGIAMAPDDGKDGATLIKHADMALYRAKKRGRFGYQFFTKGMDMAVQQRKELEVDLNAALEQSQFSNAYQPVLELESNRVSCCVSQLRWDHPKLGMVMPEEFTSVAREMGILNKIDIRAMRTACLATKNWPKGIKLCVNISAGQLVSRQVEKRIHELLKTSGTDPDRVELTINDGVLKKNAKEKLKILKKLRAMGLRIAMAISGGGNSALGTLGSFPFDKLIISSDLIAKIDVSREKREIVKAIISLGTNLGMTTAAAGVDSEAQLDILRDFGCDEVQGYLFSPPLPEHSIDELLQTIEARAADEAGIINFSAKNMQA